MGQRTIQFVQAACSNLANFNSSKYIAVYLKCGDHNWKIEDSEGNDFEKDLRVR